VPTGMPLRAPVHWFCAAALVSSTTMSAIAGLAALTGVPALMVRVMWLMSDWTWVETETLAPEYWTSDFLAAVHPASATAERAATSARLFLVMSNMCDSMSSLVSLD
jgi:hypothetical protein